MTTATQAATWVKCPGFDSDPYEHTMRDNCWSCAPFWEWIPTCPVDGTTLRHQRDRQHFYDENDRFQYTPCYCRTCRKHYDINNHPDRVG